MRAIRYSADDDPDQLKLLFSIHKLKLGSIMYSKLFVIFNNVSILYIANFIWGVKCIESVAKRFYSRGQHQVIILPLPPVGA